MSALAAPIGSVPTRLPAVDETHAPASVGSAAVKQAYATAQSFEEMLLQQLSQSLVQSSGMAGEGGGEGEGEGSSAGESEAGGGMLASLLPQTLAESVMRGGGLGLASQLTGALDPSAASAASGSTGGACAPASAVSVPSAPTAPANGAAASTGGAPA
jgi:Rod binding domain-containing protein